MRRSGRKRASLALLLAGAVALSFDEVAPGEAPADVLRAVEQLCADERFDEARALASTLVVANPFAAWGRALELEPDGWTAEAFAVAESAVDFLGLDGPSRAERAHAHYALGVVETLAGESAAAEREHAAAVARAGEGELRNAAAYNAATLALLRGEDWRAQIPELGGQPVAAPPQPALPPGAQPMSAQQAEPEPPDPLEEARKAYLEARGRFVLRLQLDWRDADARANTELVMRRLRELEEIERQREEQQQEQEQQEQEESEDEQQQDDQQQQQQDQQQDSQDDSEEQQQEQEQEQEQESQEGEDESEEEQEPQEGEQEPQEGEAEPEEQEAQPQERFLTKEEVQRLLQRLEEHEREGEELRARRQSSRRRPTPRDW